MVKTRGRNSNPQTPKTPNTEADESSFSTSEREESRSESNFSDEKSKTKRNLRPYNHNEYSNHRSASLRHMSKDRSLHSSRSYGAEFFYTSRKRTCSNRTTERARVASLRPIRRKCYADGLNSDEDKVYLTRRRTAVRFENTSWLADQQLDKVGYPKLNPIPYSEEDSREAVTNKRTPKQKETRIENRRDAEENGFDYELPESTNGKEERMITRRSKVNLRKIKEEVEEVEEAKQDEESKIADEDEESKEAQLPSKDSSDSDMPLKKLGERKTGKTSSTFSLPLPRRRRRKVDSESSDEEEGNYGGSRRNGKRYSFRERPPKPPQRIQEDFVTTPNKRKSIMFRRSRMKNALLSSTSTSDSSSDDDMKYSKTPRSDRMKKKGLAAGGSKIIPIGPETIDATVRFSSIGGLHSHVHCLKEMVLLPMMYPEVFGQFHIQPPRGVLFHGPPGTGKTLIARALANECSLINKKVSFFMRKGADLLSKWIGESEKQLRLLFEQASEMKPSIIFFDELDGLIPARSSRNDQIHASIVSTLLALMDGLDDRGEIIVIGATNRIEAIDPAFRRPGRFDRELYFPLPSRKEREEILNVYVSRWKKPPTPELISYLAEQSVGYCSSDLRALCTEAVIHSFRRTYPQVYMVEHKVLLEPEKVNVEKLDFLRAKSALVPASRRADQCVSRKLLPILQPLLGDVLDQIIGVLETIFPHGVHEKLGRIRVSTNVKPAQLLLVGDGPGNGQTEHLAPALIYRMEHINCYTLNLTKLYKDTSVSAEEVVGQVLREAERNVPSVIYVPSIDELWDLISDVTKTILSSQLTMLDHYTPILLLATSDRPYNDLPPKVKQIFSTEHSQIFNVTSFTPEKRREFFRPLLVTGCLKATRLPGKRQGTPPPLPRAPTPPPPALTEEQLEKLNEKEEHTLRELRIFLRDICRKLANNRMFFLFTKPVDTKEVPDYNSIIKQPMDLETMMMKVDFHRYECAKDFLSDIELIVNNTLEYNPARSSADKQIRHRACSLRDYAHTLIKTEMDSDFEDKCQEIARSRKKRLTKVNPQLPEYLITPEISARLENIGEVQTKDVNDDENKVIKSRKRKSLPKLKKAKKMKKEKLSEEEKKSDKSSEEDSKENNVTVEREDVTRNSNEDNDATSTNLDKSNSQQRRRLSDLMSNSEMLADPLHCDDVDMALGEAQENISEVPIDCPINELEDVLEKTVEATQEYMLDSLLNLHNEFSRIIRPYLKTTNRVDLPKELLKELNRFNKDKNKTEEQIAEQLEPEPTSLTSTNSQGSVL